MTNSQSVASSSNPKLDINPRGIPKAPFVVSILASAVRPRLILIKANVEEHVGGPDGEIESVIKSFQESSAKYRYLEVSLQQRRRALLTKLPDIESTLQAVQFLQQRRRKALGEHVDEEKEEDDVLDDLEELSEEKKEIGPLKTLFELNDTLYAEAEIEETGEVGLWLGANVMLMYPLQEAADLLLSKLEGARKSQEEVVEDLEFLREQSTVMEVNFARVHNWDVKRRRDKKQASVLLQSGKQERDELHEDRD